MSRLPLALSFALLLGGALAYPSDDSDRDDGRFLTNRAGAREIELTDEDDGAFTFAVFGDRTGGPAEGVKILAQAVEETNLLAPDLVMTVGDLVEGYNTTVDWMPQMAEFRSIMDRLDSPWFPVAGNHDMYWRGEGRPEGEHEASYEKYFGPLWYAFRHKGCWFIVLFADETNPETGNKRFNDPAHQRMSPEQFAWLQETLAATTGARHVFVFLHHPRWVGGQYGDDWARVHRMLVDAGNVSAVFAGHIHHMRYDPQDGIEYFALATVGGSQAGDLPEAGYLHQYSYVTVRDDGISTVSYPVGTAQDPRLITGEVSSVSRRATRELVTRVEGELVLDADAACEGEFELVLENPLSQAVEMSLRAPADRDPRWLLDPKHVHRVLEPGASERVSLRLSRLRGPIDHAFDTPVVVRGADVLFDGLRVPLPDVEVGLPVKPTFDPMLVSGGVLALDGRGDHLIVPASKIDVPDGPFTVEAWMNAGDLQGKRGLVCKTEGSEYGLFVSDGRPAFYVHLDGSYVTAQAEHAVLEPDRWQHVAGVFDGERLTVYVDGGEVASTAGSGVRKKNALPLVIGGDVNAAGVGHELFFGRVDHVRISQGALYEEAFEPQRRLPKAEGALLWLKMDGVLGPWVEDSSGAEAHGELRAGAVVIRG